MNTGIEVPLRHRLAISIIPFKVAKPIIERYHYLHRARRGMQVNYGIFIDGILDGVMTFSYPMMSAPFQGCVPGEVVEFSRMFLFSNVPHSATCAIGKALKRIKQDWTELSAKAKVPRLIVSWSDVEYHRGTIYKAANFMWLKRTKGRPPYNGDKSKRGERVRYADYKHDKDCWIYWLR